MWSVGESNSRDSHLCTGNLLHLGIEQPTGLSALDGRIWIPSKPTAPTAERYTRFSFSLTVSSAIAAFVKDLPNTNRRWLP
jgi:hypothetical protein